MLRVSIIASYIMCVYGLIFSLNLFVPLAQPALAGVFYIINNIKFGQTPIPLEWGGRLWRAP